MVKKYSKRQLHSGMQGRVERQMMRAYEKRMINYKKKMTAFNKYLEEMKKETKEIILSAPKTPILARTRKIKRSLRLKRKRY